MFTLTYISILTCRHVDVRWIEIPSLATGADIRTLCTTNTQSTWRKTERNQIIYVHISHIICIYIYTYYYVSVYNLYISMLIYFLGTYIGYGLIFFLLERCVKSQGKLGASTGAKDADAFPSPQSESAGAPNAAATVRMVLSEEFLEPPGGVSMNSLSQFHFQGFKIQKKIYIRFFARLVSTN